MENKQILFKAGDLIEFIPENFDYPDWNYRLIGVGYIDFIEIAKDFNGVFSNINLYHIYCGKVDKQQMKNFAIQTLTNKTFIINEIQMQKVCRIFEKNNLVNYE